MSYYDQLLERMLSYYKNQTKCTPDKASDVMIRRSEERRVGKEC